MHMNYITILLTAILVVTTAAATLFTLLNLIQTRGHKQGNKTKIQY